MSKPGAIITGAASGIGLALTKHLHEKQWKVVMMDINVAGEDIAKELGSDVLWLRCDVTNWEGLVEGFDRGGFAFLSIKLQIPSRKTIPCNIRWLAEQC